MTTDGEGREITQEDYIKAIRRIDRYHEKVGADMRIVEAYVDALESANKQWADLMERSGLRIVLNGETGVTFLVKAKPSFVMYV